MQIQSELVVCVCIFLFSSYNRPVTKKYDVIIAGGGVVGCAIAYELGRNKAGNVLVLERNETVPGINQSSRNGGVIHSGIYYPNKVEPLKARLCVDGNELMYSFCRHFDVPHKQNGKLILATSSHDEEYLKFFFHVGEENGVIGLKMLTGKEARRLEPNLSENVTMAIHVPTCGSVALDPLVIKLQTIASEYGVSFQTATKILAVTPEGDGFSLTVKRKDEETTLYCETLINAAGLYSDDIAKMVNDATTYEIEGTRGELAEYVSGIHPDTTTSGMHLYPAPFCYDNETKETVNASPTELIQLLKKGKITKTLGAHISPVFTKDAGEWSLTKTMSVGPLKNIGHGKEDYTTNAHPMNDYVNKVKTYFPNLQAVNLLPRFTGIMAVLKGKTDFVIERDKNYSNCINLVGMDSPALTASLAIAKYTYKLYKG